MDDAHAIEALVATETEAWNAGDAWAFAQRFAPDGSFTNVLGTVVYGREAFEQGHAEIFKTIFSGSVLKQSITASRFVRPDVAVVDVSTEMTGYKKVPPGVAIEDDGILRTRLQMVLVKQGEEWLISAYHNVSLMPPPKR